MGSYVDTKRLARLVKHKRNNRGLREISLEIGAVSPSTLSRVENGKMPDMDTFLLLCDWLEVSPTEFIKDDRKKQSDEPETPDSIAARLRADKNLDPATANALAAIVKAAYRELASPDNDSNDEK